MAATLTTIAVTTLLMAPATGPLIRALRIGTIGPDALGEGLLPATLDEESPTVLRKPPSFTRGVHAAADADAAAAGPSGWEPTATSLAMAELTGQPRGRPGGPAAPGGAHGDVGGAAGAESMASSRSNVASDCYSSADELEADESRPPPPTPRRRAFRRLELIYLKPVLGGRDVPEPEEHGSPPGDALSLFLAPWSEWARRSGAWPQLDTRAVRQTPPRHGQT